MSFLEFIKKSICNKSFKYKQKFVSAAVTEYFREGSENNTVVSSVNNVKFNCFETFVMSFIYNKKEQVKNEPLGHITDNFFNSHILPH